MIVDDEEQPFIFVFHPETYFGIKSPIAYEGCQLTNKEYLEHWGKWIIMGERKWLDELAVNLEDYVEQGVIPVIKYNRFPPHGLNECAMLVFCDDRDREKVWQILASFGAKMKAWMYDRETINMWMPGGILVKHWLAEHGVKGIEAERISEDIRQAILEVYGDPDAPCRGWDHFDERYLR